MDMQPVTSALPAAARPGGAVLPVTGKELPTAKRAAAVPAELHIAAADLERYVREAGRDLTFSVDEVTGQLIISVRESATGQLIRQMPSEEALRIARNLEFEGAALVSELA